MPFQLICGLLTQLFILPVSGRLKVFLSLLSKTLFRADTTCFPKIFVPPSVVRFFELNFFAEVCRYCHFTRFGVHRNSDVSVLPHYGPITLLKTQFHEL